MDNGRIFFLYSWIKSMPLSDVFIFVDWSAANGQN